MTDLPTVDEVQDLLRRGYRSGLRDFGKGIPDSCIDVMIEAGESQPYRAIAVALRRVLMLWWDSTDLTEAEVHAVEAEIQAAIDATAWLEVSDDADVATE